MIKYGKLAVAVLTLLTLAACAVGPDYQRPAVDTPTKFKEAYLSPEQAKKWMVAHPSESMDRGQWWTIFGDPTLNGLEQQALSANHDLPAAAAPVKQARALHPGPRSDLFPHVDAGSGPAPEKSRGGERGVRT